MLIDTDVFVDHIRGARRISVRASYSVITRAELFAGDARDEPNVRALLATQAEIGIDDAIAERAGRLRRDRAIAMADAVIAATAIERGLKLVTRNRRDFVGVPELRLADPALLT